MSISTRGFNGHAMHIDTAVLYFSCSGISLAKSRVMLEYHVRPELERYQRFTPVAQFGETVCRSDAIATIAETLLLALRETSLPFEKIELDQCLES